MHAAVLEGPDGWLDDEHTTAAQHLLQEQHPDVAGLQSSSLQYTRTFDVHKDHPFVQCLHENGNHWITVSTVGCSSGVVQVFTSSEIFTHTLSALLSRARYAHDIVDMHMILWILSTVLPKWCCVTFPFTKHCSKEA